MAGKTVSTEQEKKKQEMAMENNIMEMEQLRSELNTFKERLDKQQIVNDQLMRQSMKSKMSWIRKMLWIEVAVIPFCAITMGGLVYQMGLSWWWWFYTLVMLSVDVGLDFWTNRIRKDDFASGNMVETARHLAEMKRSRIKVLVFGIVMLLVWLLWLGFMLYQIASDPASSDMEQGRAWAFLVGTIIGVLIGLPIGLYIFFRMQRTNTEILRQIDELVME